MRKLLISLALMIVPALLWAADDVILLRAGDISILQKQSEALLKIDFSNTIVSTKNGNMGLDEYMQAEEKDLAKWERTRTKIEKQIEYGFNHKNKKGLHASLEGGNSPYKVLFKIQKVDFGSTGKAALAAFVPFSSKKSGGAKLWGTIDIIDNSTHKRVCTFDIDRIEATSQYATSTRMLALCEEVTSQLFKYVKKYKGGVIAYRENDDDPELGSVEQPSLSESVEEQETVESTTKVEPANLAKATPKRAVVKTRSTKGKQQSTKTSTTVNPTGKNVIVLLNNGATVVGRMVSFNPVESITVDVAGIRSTIPMSNVKSVETKD
ncbi:MAG: hypothetical protein IJ190_04435 [Prevotella sp.]|nr:hypothetical protein [Prevotella sp.]